LPPFSRAHTARTEFLNWLSAAMPDPVIERPVILIVEDEFVVRMAAAEAIRDAGFEVIDAANADDAIVVLARRRDFRVVFTDIRMPGVVV
jgi:CheY-like chemotaxis protein